MKLPGQVAILRFPSVDLSEGKSRPVLLLAKAPGAYDDWLICMISSQVHQALSGIDEIIDESDDDFENSGLKVTSVIRINRVAVAASEALQGAVGEISAERLLRIRKRLANWVLGTET